MALNATTVLRALQANAPSAPAKTEFALIGLVAHAVMTATGFRLVGLTESDNVDDGKIPEQWSGEEAWSFRYRHEQSAMTFLIKGVKMADRCITHAMAIEMREVLGEALTFPFGIRDASMPALFAAVPKLDDFVYQFKIQILHKLIPGLDKLGYEPGATPESSETRMGGTTSSGRVPMQQPPFYGQMPRPSFPGRPSLFDEPYGPDDFTRRPNPFSIGHGDLDPLAAMRPPQPGGGMMVGPNHPMFGGGVPRPQHPYAGPGPERLPPGAVPPGARFDPIMGGPMAGRPGAPGFPRPPRPPTGDPDNDELMPPGYNDMFM